MTFSFIDVFPHPILDHVTLKSDIKFSAGSLWKWYFFLFIHVIFPHFKSVPRALDWLIFFSGIYVYCIIFHQFSNLMPRTLGKVFSWRHFEIFFLFSTQFAWNARSCFLGYFSQKPRFDISSKLSPFSPQEQDLTFHGNYLQWWRQFAWNVKSCFLGRR